MNQVEKQGFVFYSKDRSLEVNKSYTDFSFL